MLARAIKLACKVHLNEQALPSCFSLICYIALCSRVDVEIEEKAQQAIEAFFSKSCVVPSPWSDTSQRRTGFHPPQTPSTPGMVFICLALFNFIETRFQ